MSDRDEWQADVWRMNEVDRELAIEEPRRARGLIGDRDDDL